MSFAVDVVVMAAGKGTRMKSARPKVLHRLGGRALAQSDASCVVYGMPKAIVDAGLADEIVDIDDMAQAIMANIYK